MNIHPRQNCPLSKSYTSFMRLLPLLMTVFMELFFGDCQYMSHTRAAVKVATTGLEGSNPIGGMFPFDLITCAFIYSVLIY